MLVPPFLLSPILLSIVLPMLILMLVALGLYYSGIKSLMLLDDNHNLKYLKFVDGGLFSHDFWRFVMGGDAGPTGRPVSLLSFALQSAHWPDPMQFKLVNIVIHGVNAILVFLLVDSVGRILGRHKKETRLISFCIALLWLVHPIHITSVLYVIQRMTSLAAMFGLIACLIYMKLISRLIFESRQPSFFGIAAVLFFLLCSILSKENGLLFSAYILCIEFLIQGRYSPNSRVRLLRMFAGYLPLLLISGYFLFTFGHVLENYESRGFSMAERLMTESRVMWTYVSAIMLPSFGKYGLFHDDTVISHGLLDPATTLISCLAWVAMLGSLWVSKIPRIIRFCVLWFLAGHMLESTFISLEIYFEHRNYAPSMGLITLLVVGFFSLSNVMAKRLSDNFGSPSKYGFLFLFLMNSVMITMGDVKLWSMPLKQAYVWADEHPGSYRVREMLVNRLFLAERYEKVQEQLQHIIQQWPNKGRTYISLVAISCRLHAQPPALERLIPGLNMAYIDSNGFDILRLLVASRMRGDCDSVDSEYLQELLSSILDHKTSADVQHLAMSMKGQLYYYDGNPDRGRQFLIDSYTSAREDEKLNVLLVHAISLVNYGDKKEAKVILSRIKQSDQWHHFSSEPIMLSSLQALESAIGEKNKL